MTMQVPVRINPLEPRLADLITSGPIVQSLPHAVEACVTNSISTGARRIAVRISPQSFGFSVEDDGRGIPASVLPRLAEQRSAAALGGGSLAALATTACLMVTSKAAAAFETFQVTLADGRAISCGLAAQQRSTQGTIVHVTDLFHSTPVRRKKMTHARAVHEAADTRERLLRLAIPYSQIELIFMNDQTQQVMLALPQGRTVYSVLAMTVGAGAAQQMLPCEASDAAGVSSISGLLSALQDGHGSKAHQLLYVNKRYCACHVFSNLINALHEQLLACQHRGQALLHDSTSRAAPSGVRRFPAFVLFLTHAASQPGTGADGAPDDRAALLRLLREALLSAWRADVPDSFLQSAAARPQYGGKQGRGAARLVGDPSEHTLENLPQSLRGRATADADRRRDAADIQGCGTAPVSDIRCRPSATGRQLVSSQKRTAWHSGPSRWLAQNIAAAGDATASLLPTRQGPARLAIDTSFRSAASPAASDRPQDRGRTWAATARLCLSPARQLKLSDPRKDAAAPQCSLPARAVSEQLGSRSLFGTAGLLEEVLAEDSATERLLHPAAHAAAAEVRQQCTQMESESGSGSAEAARSASHAPPGPAATQKRGRRASWPSMPPTKRRAVHKNPSVSKRAVVPAHAASLPMTTTTSNTLGEVGEQRKHAQFAIVRNSAVTNSETGNPGKQSRALHKTHGWKQRKQCWPEQPSSVKVASAPSHHSGLRPAPKPRVDEHQQPAAPRPLDALLAAWQNPCVGHDVAEQDVLQLSDLAPGLAYLAVPQAVDRAGFMHARVLQQVDRKFVIMDCNGILMAMDQHAADERVRLEDLRDRLLAAVAAGAGRPSPASDPAQPSARHMQPLGRSATVHSSPAAAATAAASRSSTEGKQTSKAAAVLRVPVAESVELLASKTISSSPSGGLTDSEWHLYEAYSDQVERWGWCAEANAEGGFRVVAVPRIFGTLLTPTDLKVYLHELGQTAGTASIPVAARCVLNSKACRSAIMFGDPLTAADCGLLVERLQRTQQCFSCAHGRPTMAPLADMLAIRRLIEGRRKSATGPVTGSAMSPSCAMEPARGTDQLYKVLSNRLP